MKWLIYCFLIIQTVWYIECAPAEENPSPEVPAVVVVTGDERPSEEKPDCKDAVTDVYDQRQNGSENIRLHLKGVGIVISFAPEAGDAVIQNIVNEQNMNNEDTVSLKPPNQEGAPLPIEGGIRERGRYKWGNLLQILKHLRPASN